MSITKEQMIDLGFKPAKMAKGLTNRKYDTLIYPLNKTDYIYTGYNRFTKEIDFKRLWKCFKDPESEETITYPIEKIGVLSYEIVKEYLEHAVRTAEVKKEIYG